MRLIELLNEVQYGQIISVEFNIGIISGTVQVLVKALDADAISTEIKMISAENNVIRVVLEE